ncbi:MAG: HNH endonuclease [Gammaproteobacteria bacterium]|nr:HNH endonuclease [Gammaproteobacteria bacterium]
MGIGNTCNLKPTASLVLACEVCDFNFTKTYGIRGKDYIECHHKNPLSDTKVGEKTKTEDLALLCANCHRVIHRYKPWISVEKLKEQFKGQL